MKHEIDEDIEKAKLEKEKQIEKQKRISFRKAKVANYA